MEYHRHLDDELNALRDKDAILFGSNKLYIVTEMTVPGLRHAKQLMLAGEPSGPCGWARRRCATSAAISWRRCGAS